MLLNVELRERLLNGKRTWILIGPDGHELSEFTLYAQSMAEDKINSLEANCRHTAFFIDYVIEAVNSLKSKNILFELSHFELDRVINSYSDYILNGIESENEIAALVAVTKPINGHKSSSLNAMMAAVRKFLIFSESLRLQMQQFADLGLIQTVVDPLPLTFGTMLREKIDPFQRHAMTQNSVLAAVIRGGARFIRKSPRRSSPKGAYRASRAFPIEKIAQLIENVKSFSEKSFYSFLAATLSRKSEAEQLLISDIDFVNRSALLIDPRSRLNGACYRNLSALEKQCLVWKGRVTEESFMLEPFATMFFEFAELYLRHEYIPHGSHDFFFQWEDGTPLYLNKSGRFHRNFKKAIAGLELSKDIDGAHCLRHGVATYLLNCCPRSDGGIGLDMADVSYIIGHGNVKSTGNYAIKDMEIRRQMIEHANSVIFGGPQSKDFRDIQIDYHESQIIKLRAAFQGKKGIEND